MNYRKLTLIVLTLFTLALFAACAGTTPEASQEVAAPVVEADATEAPAEEAAPTEAVATEEASGEASTAGDGETATYTVDTTASSIEWFGSKPIGATERGTVAIDEGQLIFTGSELVEGSFVIDMASIDTTTQSGNMKGMLEGHLKSDEFFGVELYPTATLVIKSVEPGAVENQYTVVADLTIKETTEEIEFVTDVVVGDDTLEATAEILVDRSIYDIRYGSGAFFTNLGDDLISDEMELTVKLVARS